MSRESRRRIVDENLEILKNGFYLYENVRKNLKLSFEERSSVDVFSPDFIDEIISENTRKAYVYDVTNIEVNELNSFEASYAVRERGNSIAVLSFANANTPGGGFLKGANAQEEVLCRQSSLFQSISNKKAKIMYETNMSRVNSTTDSDFMLISGFVEVFRRASGEYLEDSFTTAVLSLPAPNVRIRASKLTKSELSAERCNKLRKAFHVARYAGYDTMILGPWGCGAYGNDVLDVANDMRTVLFDEGLVHFFKKIVFAVHDTKPEKPNYSVFLDVFRETSVHRLGKDGVRTDSVRDTEQREAVGSFSSSSQERGQREFQDFSNPHRGVVSRMNSGSYEEYEPRAYSKHQKECLPREYSTSQEGYVSRVYQNQRDESVSKMEYVRPQENTVQREYSNLYRGYVPVEYSNLQEEVAYGEDRNSFQKSIPREYLNPWDESMSRERMNRQNESMPRERMNHQNESMSRERMTSQDDFVSYERLKRQNGSILRGELDLQEGAVLRENLGPFNKGEVREFTDHQKGMDFGAAATSQKGIDARDVYGISSPSISQFPFPAVLLRANDFSASDLGYIRGYFSDKRFFFAELYRESRTRAISLNLVFSAKGFDITREAEYASERYVNDVEHMLWKKSALTKHFSVLVGGYGERFEKYQQQIIDYLLHENIVRFFDLNKIDIQMYLSKDDNDEMMVVLSILLKSGVNLYGKLSYDFTPFGENASSMRIRFIVEMPEDGRALSGDDADVYYSLR